MPSRATLIADALSSKKAPDAPDVFSAPRQSWAEYSGYEGMPAPQAEGMPTHDPDGTVSRIANALATLPTVQTIKDQVMLPRQILAGEKGVPQSFEPTTPDAQTDEAIGFGLSNAVRPGAAMSIAKMPLAPGEAVLGAGPIRAYHGSPHDFDKFDLSKIGTGEGAQAYGHGLYFAEKESVAKSYRDAMGPGAAFDAIDRFLLQRRGFNFSPEEMVQRLKADTRLAPLADDPKAVNALRDLLPTYTPNAPVTGKALDHYRYLNDAVEKAVPGRMYEVAIHADSGKFLDYDAPLRAQPKEVHSVLGDGGNPNLLRPKDRELARIIDRAVKDAGDPREVPLIVDNDQALYNAALAHAKRNLPPEQFKMAMDLEQSPGDYIKGQADPYLKALAAREVSGDDLLKLYRQREPELKAAGVPGVKYLDAGSRSALDGSRNYVVFSPEIVEILRKYGVGSIAALPPAVQMAIQLHQDQIQAEPQEPTFAAKASGMINNLQRKLRGPEPPATPLGMGIRG